MDTINTADAAQKAGSDAKVVGNPDNWKLLTKFSSASLGIAKSTKGCHVEGLGVVLQVTTKEGAAVAEAVTFIPGAKIAEDTNGGFKLVKE